MSRLPATALAECHALNGGPDEPKQLSKQTVSDQFGLESMPEGTFPLRYNILDKYQKEDEKLLENLKRGVYSAKTFREGRKEFLLICKN